MKATIIEPSRPLPQLLAELDKVFIKDNMVQPVGLEEVLKIPRNDLRVYCNQRGIYTIVTHELVAWLQELIGERSCIEIGSGNGTLGRALGIRCTDNKMQADPAIAMTYLMMGQPVIKYPDFVEQIDGLEAIKKYKPEVVLGSWITHRYYSNEHEKGGNQWAPDEKEIMDSCDTYVLVGNLGIHQGNRLFNSGNYNFMLHRPKGLLTRAEHYEQDAVMVFTRK